MYASLQFWREIFLCLKKTHFKVRENTNGLKIEHYLFVSCFSQRKDSLNEEKNVEEYIGSPGFEYSH